MFYWKYNWRAHTHCPLEGPLTQTEMWNIYKNWLRSVDYNELITIQSGPIVSCCALLTCFYCRNCRYDGYQWPATGIRKHWHLFFQRRLEKIHKKYDMHESNYKKINYLQWNILVQRSRIGLVIHTHNDNNIWFHTGTVAYETAWLNTFGRRINVFSIN